MPEAQTKPNDLLRLEWIEPDDDGLDLAWLELSDSEKWEQIRRFMKQSVALVQRTQKLPVNPRVDKTQGFFTAFIESDS